MAMGKKDLKFKGEVRQFKISRIHIGPDPAQPSEKIKTDLCTMK